MTLIGSEQRVYGKISSVVTCPCCYWKWTDAWQYTMVYGSIKYGYYPPSPIFISVGTTKFVYDDGTWTNTTYLYVPSDNNSVKGIVGKISPECQIKYDDLSCKSIITGFAGYYLNEIWESQSYYDVVFRIQNTKTINAVTSVDLWIQCDYQHPGSGYVNFYINGAKVGSVFHGSGWSLVSVTYPEPIQITSMVLERTSSISNNGAFTINFQGLKINGKCIHKVNV